MTSSVFFFALPSDHVDLSLPEIAKKAHQWISTNGGSQSKRDAGLIDRICKGDMPEECKSPWFDAMLAIAFGNLEPIEFEALSEMRDHSQTEAAGILLPMLKIPPPFRVPKSRQHYPCIGYFSGSQYQDFRFIPGGKLSEADRMEFEEELASLLQDLGMDKEYSNSASKLNTPISASRIRDLQEQFDFLLGTIADDKLDLLSVYI